MQEIVLTQNFQGYSCLRLIIFFSQDQWEHVVSNRLLKSLNYCIPYVRNYVQKMLNGIAPGWGNSGQEKKTLFDEFFDLLRDVLKT